MDERIVRNLQECIATFEEIIIESNTYIIQDWVYDNYAYCLRSLREEFQKRVINEK